jgi:hypothetical protein
MSKCIFQTIPKLMDGAYAKVYSPNECGEYVAKYYNHRGVHMDASDYFSNDREDAIFTVLLQVAVLYNASI